MHRDNQGQGALALSKYRRTVSKIKQKETLT